VLSDDRKRIVHLEERLKVGVPDEGAALAELEMLADLYMQADSYVPALETIERLLGVPEARTLSATRRAALESKGIACRLAQGDCINAIAHCREALRDEFRIEVPGIRARLHLHCADALFRLGRPEDSRREAQIGLAIADESGELSLAALALNMLGKAVYRAGDLDMARDYYEQALALYRRLGDEANTAHLRNNLGLIHKNLCEWGRAITHLTAALKIHRKHGRYGESGHPLLNLGIVHQKSGDWEQALASYAQAEEVYRRVGDRLHLTMVQIGQGNVARLQRRSEAAETALSAALERARELQAHREEVLALEFLGELDFDRGRPTAALDRYAAAIRIAERHAPEGDLVVELERRRAEALAALGRLDEAERACERSRKLASRTQDRLEFALSHRVAGDIAMARGRRHEALSCWHHAASLLQAGRERFELGRTFLRIGRAVEDGNEARRCFYRAGALFAELTTPYWLEQSERDLQDRIGPQAEPAPAPPGSLLGRRHRAPGLVACSLPMRRVETLARRAAATELSVLITGATGTGKELIARTIHSLSPRAQKPFLAVNCGALRADLALSQLFGHRKGAFTGAHDEGVGLVEAAHGGTLFLDEVGELPADVQVTLLRFLESGEYLRLGETQVRRADARVIAATNRELRGREAERLFRRDLLFRLNEIEIRVPALVERGVDILPLARHFLAFYGGIDGPRLTTDAESLLHSHSWPGNVRELENVMKRIAALHADEAEVGAQVLLPFLVRSDEADAKMGAKSPDERSALIDAVERAAGNRSRAADLLGISRKTFYARVRRHGIQL
jgi:DNA-binding NtrC family response regulator/predicted negative regulator of RcsB-dependent stress response